MVAAIKFIFSFRFGGDTECEVLYIHIYTYIVATSLNTLHSLKFFFIQNSIYAQIDGGSRFDVT